jgi:hypothetical protein
MEGGRILGEGVDGCVFSEPMWPCAQGTTQGQIPDTKDAGVVSKIIKSTDTESKYLEASNRILGPELSKIYLAGLRGQCKPANSSHPPASQNLESFKKDQAAVLEWKNSQEACGDLKRRIKSGKGITNEHKLMYISRYPSTLNEWSQSIRAKNIPISYTMNAVNDAIPNFIYILQLFYQNPSEQLVHLDLHHANIFVRAQSNSVQFGIADFGHCLLRQYSNPASNIDFIPRYIKTYQERYELFAFYKQIPLEARILNFCFKRNMDDTDPAYLVTEWMKNEDVVQQSYLNDIVAAAAKYYMGNFLKRPLFIAMVELLQGISSKMRREPLVLNSDETVAMEFIVTRYMAVSPFVTICEQMLNLFPDTVTRAEITNIVTAHYARPVLQPQQQQIKNIVGGGSTVSQFYNLIEFIIRVLEAPYTQVGSSLSSALKAVQGADLRIVWSDIARGD